ncbi:hypothetical protein [Deinococcus radiophilus]|nr:hypothetical protein [Deinococcus radiophilus]UFA51915.1 hypothetical protein LMT64_13380 [Deinococcus radiophilus]
MSHVLRGSQSINSISQHQRDKSQIKIIHESLWPKISEKIGEISLNNGIESKRSIEEKIDEVLSYHTFGYGGYEELLREQHQLSLRMYDLLRVLSSDRLSDSSTVKSLLLSSVSMQVRAFLKPAKLKISNDNQQIILSYDARGAFHARQLVTKVPELEEAVARLLGDTYEIIVISNHETVWPATPLLD